MLPLWRIQYFRSTSRTAFSLIELLAVVAIIGLVATLSIGGLSSSDSTKFASQSWTIMDSLQNAREFARAKRTYVWVGLTSGNQPGEIILSAHYSSNGLDNLAPSELVSAMKPRVLSGVGLSDQLSGTGTSADLLQNSDLGTLAFSVGGANYSASQLVEFAPDGSARVLSVGGQSIIGIPLVAIKAGQQLSHSTTDILISRLTGNLELVRN